MIAIAIIAFAAYGYYTMTKLDKFLDKNRSV